MLALAACGAATPDADSSGVPAVLPAARDVARVMGELLPRVRACGTWHGETVQVAVMFANDGHVISVKANGPYPACVQAVVADARLAPFRQPTFRITYPYRLYPTEPSPASPDGVRLVPSRDDVVRVMVAAQPEMAACSPGFHTSVHPTMHFVSDGHVASVDVPAGTPMSSCVAEVASRVRLPPFRQSTFTVTFPFSL